MAEYWPAMILEQAGKSTTEAAELAARSAPGVTVDVKVLFGSVPRVLIETSATAELLVLGTRGRREVVDFCLGSVAHTVTAHARCPVVIAAEKDAPTPSPDHPVVVGVDGSGSSDAALEFAARTAAATGAPLVVVAAWSTAGVDTWLVPYSDQGAPTPDEVLDWAGGPAREAVEHAEQIRDRYPDLVIRSQVRRGPTVRVLAEAAQGAALLVVGTRGRGSLSNLVLGSVSHGVIRAAHCPVAVVAHEHRTTAATSGAATSGAARN
jgi:nucleotide-binding universal stress UspA family protein